MWQVSSELGSQWSEVIAPQEVATLGALCSLASFTRPELKSNVIENVNMREFLELVPEVCALTAPHLDLTPSAQAAGVLTELGMEF